MKAANEQHQVEESREGEIEEGNGNEKNDHKNCPSPYSMCSKEEIQERQRIGQVSVFESTKDTFHLQQNLRQLDPCLAIAKYRRSAAGGSKENCQPLRTRSQLSTTLHQLIFIFCHQASQNNYNHNDNCNYVKSTFFVMAEFVMDRLRAWQMDATRASSLTLSSTPQTTCMQHLYVARLLILLRYLLQGHEQFQFNSFLDKSCLTMISTALDNYWTHKPTNIDDTVDDHRDDDDEILALTALLHVSNCLIESKRTNTPTLSYSWILWHFNKHVARRSDHNRYPQWHTVLKLTSCIVQDQMAQVIMKGCPILQKCCLAPALPILRFGAIQQYNTSFGKGEAVSDLNRLLFYKNSHVDCQLFGLPVDDGNEVVIMKKAPCTFPEDYTKLLNQRQDDWVFSNETPFFVNDAATTASNADSDGVVIPDTDWLMSAIYNGTCNV